MQRLLTSILLMTVLVAPSGALPHVPTAHAAARQTAHLVEPVRPRYTVTDLGTLGGATQAYGINDKGQVVGFSRVASSGPVGQPNHAFIWANGVMTDLGTLPGYHQSMAFDINNAGQVVGLSGSPAGDDDTQAAASSVAFLWQNGAMQAFGALGGADSQAAAINRSGQFVGTADILDTTDPETPSEWPHAARWAGGALDLGTLGGHMSDAYDINDDGQIVGASRLAGDNEDRAFLWQNGSMQDLGTLVGNYSQAIAINNVGKVVGSTSVVDGWHAFLWDGSMHDLGSLGGIESLATDINDIGQVVGTSATTSQLFYRAFLWERGQMKDLNTMIPADAGWVLERAEAINKRGQIAGWGRHNGQTRGFLLTPLAYYWVNPNGGSWHLATNWDPQGIPGDGDTARFDLNGVYAVDATAPPAVAQVEAAHPLARMVISSTTTVDFNNLNLSLTSDSPEEPSLEVNRGSTVNVNSGAAALAHAIVGGQDPDDPTNPPTARLQVFNDGTTLTGSGRLTIGDKGLGDLFVANGGHLTSAESRLGGTRAGTVVVGGEGSLWQTGSIAVGFGVSGTLTIEAGGRVDSKTASVGYGPFSRLSLVEVDGVASGGASSLWSVEENLTVGEGNTADVIVRKGAQLAVNQNVFIKQGSLSVIETTPGGDGSSLNVLGHVVVGGSPDYGAALTLNDGAEGEIGGNLVVGQGGPGVLIVSADPNSTHISKLTLDSVQAGLCAFGRGFEAVVGITFQSIVTCRNVEIGQAGTNAPGTVWLTNSILLALEIVRVGAVGGGPALVLMDSFGVSTARLRGLQGVYIAPTGIISGTGHIVAGGDGVIDAGLIHPGIQIVSSAQTSSAGGMQGGPASLTISGTLTMSPTARLEIPVAGSGAGQYGSLAVTGTVAMDGVLALNFGQGFLPRKGDKFTLLTATAGIKGAFDLVEVNGLGPGFTYTLSIANDQIVVTALNDGTLAEGVFLPLVTR